MADSTPLNKKLRKLIDDGKFTIGKESLPQQEYYSSGSVVLDYAMGKGFPRGKFIEIYGQPSNGKTLLCLAAAAQVTQRGEYVLYSAVEDDFNTQELCEWPEKIGIDMDYFIRKPATSAEQMIDDTVEILKEADGQIGMMVIDSLGAIVSGKQIEKRADEKTVAEEARLIRKWINQLINVKKNTCILMVNQEIAKIGTYMGGTTTKGGSAPAYFSAIRLQVKGKKIVDPRGELYGVLYQEMMVNVTKNKVATPGKVAELIYDFPTMQYDQGTELIQLGLRTGLITKNTSMYSITINGEEKKYKGKEAFKEFLASDDESRQWLIKNIFD